MSKAQYKLDYSDGDARQVGQEIVGTAAPRVANEKRKRRFRIPAAANTAITVIICGTLFFLAVARAPVGWRPQDFTGEYVSEISAKVKAREASIQAQLDTYNTQVKAAAEQHNMQFNQTMAATLDLYKALYQINQAQVEANNRMRGMYMQQQMGQAAQASGSNLGIANIAELIGQAQNIFEPGSGDAALAAAERQRTIARDRMKDTAIESAAVDVSPLVGKLPTPEQLQAQLAKVPAFNPPPLPKFVQGGK